MSKTDVIEWNAETREKFYAALSKGKLDEACKPVIAKTDLKQNDNRPADKAGLKSFGDKLTDDQKLKEQVMMMLVHDLESMNRVGRFLLTSTKVLTSKDYVFIIDLYPRLILEDDHYTERELRRYNFYLKTNDTKEDFRKAPTAERFWYDALPSGKIYDGVKDLIIRGCFKTSDS